MSRSIHRRAGRAALPIALLGVLTATSGALAAVSWDPVVVIRPQNGSIGELSARGQNVALAHTIFQEGVGPRVVIEESLDGGASFTLKTRPRLHLDRHTSQPALDSGGGRHWAAWIEYRSEPSVEYPSRLLLGSKPFGAGTWSIRNATPISSLIDWPEIAHSPSRVFATYQALVGDRDHAFITHARTEGGAFTEPIDLGRAYFPQHLAVPHVAATPRMVAVVWVEDFAEIRLQRGWIGPGPEYAIDWLPSQWAGRAFNPRVAIVGDRVIVFWHEADRLGYRIFTDHGATLGPARSFFLDDHHSGLEFIWPSEIAASGDRLVVTTVFSRSGGPFEHYRLTSQDAGTTWRVARTSDDASVLPRSVAFLYEGERAKLAEAWMTGERYAILFHREH